MSADFHHSFVEHAPETTVVHFETVHVRGPIVVAHQQQQLDAGTALVQAPCELDERALEENPLVRETFGSGRMLTEVSPDHDDVRTSSGGDGHELFIEAPWPWRSEVKNQ